MGVGSFDEFQQRFESTMPASAPQDVMAQVKTWQQALDLIEAKAPFGLLIYRKGDVHSVMKLAGNNTKCAYYLIGNFTVAEAGFAVDPSVFLYFPFQVCLWEGPDGRPGSRWTSRAARSRSSRTRRSRMWRVSLTVNSDACFGILAARCQTHSVRGWLQLRSRWESI
jgi:hypothetical protein